MLILSVLIQGPRAQQVHCAATVSSSHVVVVFVQLTGQVSSAWPKSANAAVIASSSTSSPSPGAIVGLVAVLFQLHSCTLVTRPNTRIPGLRRTKFVVLEVVVSVSVVLRWKSKLSQFCVCECLCALGASDRSSKELPVWYSKFSWIAYHSSSYLPTFHFANRRIGVVNQLPNHPKAQPKESKIQNQERVPFPI